MHCIIRGERVNILYVYANGQSQKILIHKGKVVPVIINLIFQQIHSSNLLMSHQAIPLASDSDTEK